MTHTVIVPGVGGSEQHHWQSWLQRQLSSCSRVEQNDWNLPVLSDWVSHLISHVQQLEQPVQIVAHSFGCLTTLAALEQHPQLINQVKHVTLVAPANPERFGEAGFARDSQTDYRAYFHQLKPSIKTQLIISENDPWLDFEEALQLAKSWQVRATNLGKVGHINVASGFGPFPEIFDYMLPDCKSSILMRTGYSERMFKFAL